MKAGLHPRVDCIRSEPKAFSTWGGVLDLSDVIAYRPLLKGTLGTREAAAVPTESASQARQRSTDGYAFGPAFVTTGPACSANLSKFFRNRPASFAAVSRYAFVSVQAFAGCKISSGTPGHLATWAKPK
jgi:hypothetical protein